jgi:uncharacterized protein YuzE
MKIRYFTDTDTLYIEFRDRPIAETRDLDENTILDVDRRQHLCDHSRARVNENWDS